MTSLSQKSINNSLTRSNKSVIISWGMPDYSSGISVSYSTLASGYTAPSDGVLMGGCNPNGNAEMTLNGEIVWLGYESIMPIFIPMKLGDIVKIDNIDPAGNSIIFYPYKGVSNA